MTRLLSILMLCAMTAGAQTVTNRCAVDIANRSESERDYVPAGDWTTNSLRLWLPFLVSPTNSTTYNVGDCSPWRNVIGQTNASARPAWASSAVTFDGVDDHLYGSDSILTNDVTIMAWWQRTASGASRILTWSDNAGSNTIFLFEGAFTGALTNEVVGIGQSINATTRLYYASTSGIGNNVLTNGWHLIGAHMSSTNTEIWIDATNQSLTAIVAASGVVAVPACTNVWIGMLPSGTSRFVTAAAKCDRVIVYQRRLTGAEWTNAYNSTRPTL